MRVADVWRDSDNDPTDRWLSDSSGRVWCKACQSDALREKLMIDALRVAVMRRLGLNPGPYQK